MKYLWTEDTGAGLHFWKLVNQLFFDNALVVESKESNQGILDSFGINADGSRTVRKLRKRIRGKKKSSQTQEIIRKQWQEQNKENKRI